MSKSILIVEDDELQRQMLQMLLLRKLEFSSYTAENGKKALDILAQDSESQIKLVIMDLNMPVMGGMETLEIIKQRYPTIPVIMLTGSKDIDDATNAMKFGALDFITKPYEPERVLTTVRNTLKISTLSREVNRLSSEKKGVFTFENLIGANSGLLPTISIARKAASSNIPVLITGETGTGKEVFAKAIHGESIRSGKPFIAVNCGAIPTQLVESTLFGHEKGSFTGATEKVIGKFREAEGGTIFLDEVGELPLETQVKLLRVLQQKEVEPVGAGKPVPVDIRVISATNRDLEKEVSKGNFREDLFFRLNVLHFELPPLRQRKQDISMLSDHFIERFCARENMIPKYLSEQSVKKLQGHHWNGNVRELENTINRALVLADDSAIKPDDIILQGSEHPTEPKTLKTEPSENSNQQHISLLHYDGRYKTIDEIEQEVMHIVLERKEGNVTQTAKALGIAKSTFYKKMQN